MKYSLFLFLFIALGCQPQEKNGRVEPFPLSQNFKNYWFDGTAELSSYQLTQSRYDSPREGHAVLIYVIEDFLTKEQVKANKKSKASQIVLKLNRTKKFNTGIYPYSIMTSLFTFLGHTKPLAKITTSVQEWCGQAYTQLNRKEKLEISSNSYFEGEADEKLSLQDILTEDEIWNWIRTQPDQLPLGTLKILPSFEYIRLKHKPIKPYKAEGSIQKGQYNNIYKLTYPELNREFSISFSKEVPHEIIGWEEKDLKNPNQITTAIRIKTLKLPYWTLNHIGDEHFRDSLGLK
tara:strand:- start:9827 stop:10699 length:873 start_codon:yes stop_codon:yes gene_type:complete